MSFHGRILATAVLNPAAQLSWALICDQTQHHEQEFGCLWSESAFVDTAVVSSASVLSRKLDTAGYLYRGGYFHLKKQQFRNEYFYPDAKLSDIDSDLITLRYNLPFKLQVN